MAQSERTLKCKKRRNIFFAIDTLLWVGTAIFMVFASLRHFGNSEPLHTGEFLSDSAKSLLISVSTTAIVGLIASIVIKDKIRTAMWMASVIMGSILYGPTAMYIVLALWLVDEYAIHTIYKHYREKVSINKEIDLRG